MINSDVLEKIRKRVYEISTSYHFELYKNMARWLLIELACKCGISQADFHFNNFLLDTEYDGYYQDSNEIKDNKRLLPVDVNENNNKKSKNSFETIQFGGNLHVNKGRVILIDYGLSNMIPKKDIENLKQWYIDLYENNDIISDEDMKNIITKILQIIYSVIRNDGLKLEKAPSWYSWIIGGYFSGGPEQDNVLLSGRGINDDDIEMIRSIIKARKNAIQNLKDKFNLLEQPPFTLPLSEEIINERTYRGHKTTGGNRYENNIDDLVYKAFETLEYGLLSRDYLSKK